MLAALRMPVWPICRHSLATFGTEATSREKGLGLYQASHARWIPEPGIQSRKSTFPDISAYQKQVALWRGSNIRGMPSVTYVPEGCNTMTVGSIDWDSPDLKVRKLTAYLMSLMRIASLIDETVELERLSLGGCFFTGTTSC